MADFKIVNIKEYRHQGKYVADIEYDCPCGRRHNDHTIQTDPIMVVTLKAPCGFTAPVALPMLEPE